MDRGQRIEYLDLAKGFSILCVLIGHCFLSEKLNIVIYSFHMPLFFFVSGYLSSFQANSRLELWMKKKANKLVGAYLLSCILTIIGSICIESVIDYCKGTNLFQENLAKWLEASIIGNGYYINFLGKTRAAIGPTWFLLALFWALLFFEIMKRVCPNKYNLLLAFILALVGILSCKYFELPWAIQEGMVGALFVVVGCWYKEYYNIFKEWIRLHAFITTIFAGAYIVICLICNKHIDMVSNTYPLGLIDILGTIFVVIFIIDICKLIDGGASECHNLSERCIILFKRCGKHSLTILLIHTIEFNIFPWGIIRAPFRMVNLEMYSGIAIAIIRVAYSIIVANMMERRQRSRIIQRQS